MKNEKNFSVLVVEDDKLNAEVMSKFIKSNAKVDKIHVETFQEVDNALEEIKRNEAKPHIVILSEPMHGKVKFASEIYGQINQFKKASPASEVIVMANPTRVETVIDTFRSGAFDVVLKDDRASRNVVNSIHRFVTAREEKNNQRHRESITAI